MTTDDLQNPQGEPSATPVPPATPPASDERDSTDWKASYTGLQRKYQALFDTKEQLQSEADQRATELAELGVTLDALRKEKTTSQEQLSVLQKSLQDKDGRIKEMEASLSRWDIVKDEFPTLVKVAHLVPIGEPDEMRAAFKTLGETINELSDDKAKILMAGAVPRGGGGRQEPPTLTMEQIWQKIEETAGTPEGEKWSELWAQRKLEQSQPG